MLSWNGDDLIDTGRIATEWNLYEQFAELKWQGVWVCFCVCLCVCVFSFAYFCITPMRVLYDVYHLYASVLGCEFSLCIIVCLHNRELTHTGK